MKYFNNISAKKMNKKYTHAVICTGEKMAEVQGKQPVFFRLFSTT